MSEEAQNFLLGVLDDYSNRYIAFGALFATSLFGIYALMALEFNSYPKLLMIFCFLALYGAGTISIAFTFRYTQLTARITEYCINHSWQVKAAWEEAVIQNDLRILRRFTEFLFRNPGLSFGILWGIYTVITIGPFLYYIEFL